MYPDRARSNRRSTYLLSWLFTGRKCSIRRSTPVPRTPRLTRLTSYVLVYSLLRVPSRWADAVLVPQGSFSATISQTILSEYVASYAYTVPDFDGNVKMTLTSTDSGEDAACIQTLIENGKSARAPAITCVTAGIAAAALGLSFFRALSAAGH